MAKQCRKDYECWRSGPVIDGMSMELHGLFRLLLYLYYSVLCYKCVVYLIVETALTFPLTFK